MPTPSPTPTPTPEPTGRIGDWAWWDQNEDGLQTSGEPGLGAVKVQLYREFLQSDGSGWDLMETKVTGSNGSYEFTGLPDGKYSVEFTPPNGWHHGWGLTSSLVGADRQIDSDGWLVSVDIVDGSSHNDIDVGFVLAGQFTFTVLENSPIGTVVGSVPLWGATSYSLTPGYPFGITNDGTITVIDPTFLDYEFKDLWEPTVIRYRPTGNSVIQVKIIVIDVNEGPEYAQSTNLVVAPFHWVGLPFDDPEGDTIVSVDGDPQHGILLMNDGFGPSTSDVFWVPIVTPTDDSFTLTASDGETTGDPVNINIDVDGEANFGIFKLGTTPPAMNVDLDPGATGIVADIPFPERGWGTEIAGPADLAFMTYIPIHYSLVANFSAEAIAGINRYLANTGNSYTYNLHQVLTDSAAARDGWSETINALVATVDTKAFVGTIELIEKVARLENTGGSVWEKAIGQFTAWGDATVTGSIENGKVKFDMTFTYNLWDPYDWDPTKRLWGGQPPLADLHLAGLAKQYMTGASYTVNVSWLKGELPSINFV